VVAVVVVVVVVVVVAMALARLAEWATPEGQGVRGWPVVRRWKLRRRWRLGCVRTRRRFTPATPLEGTPRSRYWRPQARRCNEEVQ